MTNFSPLFRLTKPFLNQQYFHTIEVCLEQCLSLILLFLFHFGFETPLGRKSFCSSLLLCKMSLPFGLLLSCLTFGFCLLLFCSFFSAMFSSSKKKAGNSERRWDDEQLHP